MHAHHTRNAAPALPTKSSHSPRRQEARHTMPASPCSTHAGTTPHHACMTVQLFACKRLHGLSSCAQAPLQELDSGTSVKGAQPHKVAASILNPAAMDDWEVHFPNMCTLPNGGCMHFCDMDFPNMDDMHFPNVDGMYFPNMENPCSMLEPCLHFACRRRSKLSTPFRSTRRSS
jgi:hypothetical protein